MTLQPFGLCASSFEVVSARRSVSVLCLAGHASTLPNAVHVHINVSAVTAHVAYVQPAGRVAVQVPS